MEIAAQVEGTNVPVGSATLNFDKRYLQLTSGAAAVKLLAGTFQQVLTWTLEAIREVEETCVRISFGPQVAIFPVKVPGLRRVR